LYPTGFAAFGAPCGSEGGGFLARGVRCLGYAPSKWVVVLNQSWAPADLALPPLVGCVLECRKPLRGIFEWLDLVGALGAPAPDLVPDFPSLGVRPLLRWLVTVDGLNGGGLVAHECS